MRVVIDARESGTSTGRYVDKLVEYLHKLQPAHEFIVLTKPARAEFLKVIAPSFKIEVSDIKEFSFAEQLKLNRQIKKLRPALVHFTMPQQPAFYRGKTVTTIHDLTTVRFNNPSKNATVFKFKQLIYAWLIKRVAKKSQKIIAISQYTKKDLLKFAGIKPEKVSVIYEAADKINEPAEPIDGLAGKKFILHVGRPNPHKNLQRLVESMEILKQNSPDVVLVLAGKTDDNYKKLQKFTSDKNLASQVYFTGFVSEGQLRWLYENAVCYAFPSLAEGFGLPGLEAMCYSLPVASSSATCLPEIYQDAALYFNPYDTKDIAEKLAMLIDNPDLTKDLVAKGQALLKKYSWQKMARETLEVYENFLKD